MVNVIAILIAVGLVGGACAYIKKSSRKGIKCVGCPYAQGCSAQASCDSGKGQIP